AGKIFVGWGRHDDGGMSMGFKTDKELQAMLVASDPRFTVAAYVGKHGWVDMKLGPKPDWAEVEQFVVQSYRMIAPTQLVQARAAPPPAGAAPAPRAAPKAKAAAKPAAKAAKAKVASKPAAKAAPAKAKVRAKR